MRRRLWAIFILKLQHERFIQVRGDDTALSGMGGHCELGTSIYFEVIPKSCLKPSLVVAVVFKLMRHFPPNVSFFCRETKRLKKYQP